MEFAKLYVIVAQSAEYNCESYGTGAYGTCATTTGSSPGGGTSGGALANTGFDIILPVSLAIAILVASVIYVFRRWRRHKA